MQHADTRGTNDEAGTGDATPRAEAIAGDGRLDLGGRVALLETRVAELEAQVAALEAVPDEGMRLEALLGRFIPAEVLGHMKTARREDMLALRSLLDAWIARLDRERGGGSGDGGDGPRKGRETIVLE